MGIIKGSGIVYVDQDPGTMGPGSPDSAEIRFNVTNRTLWLWIPGEGKWKNPLADIQNSRSIDTNNLYSVNADFVLPPATIFGELRAVYNEPGAPNDITVTATPPAVVEGNTKVKNGETGLFIAVNFNTWSRVGT